MRAGVQRLDDRGVVRRQRRPAHPARASCRCGTRARRPPRCAATRRAGRQAITFTELPANLGLPVDPRPGPPLGPAASRPATRRAPSSACTSDRVRRCPATSPDAPVGRHAPRSRRSTPTWRWPTGCCPGRWLRFPNLKIAFSESQVGWMPFLLERLDRVFTNSGAWSDLDPSLTDAPVDATCPGACSAASSTTWSASTPATRSASSSSCSRPTTRTRTPRGPHTPELVAEIGERVPPEELEMLVRTNAITMLDLEPGDLRPEHLRPTEAADDASTPSSATAPSSTAPASRPTAPTSASSTAASPRSAASGNAAAPISTPTGTSSRPASSTATPTWTRRCSGTSSARTRAGTA